MTGPVGDGPSSRQQGDNDDSGDDQDDDEYVETHDAEISLLRGELVGVPAEAILNSSVDGGLPAASSSVPRGAAAGSGWSILSPVFPRLMSWRIRAEVGGSVIGKDLEFEQFFQLATAAQTIDGSIA